MGIQASMHRIVTKFGNSKYSLISVTSGAVDPDYPSKGPVETTTTHPIKSYPGRYKDRQIDGEVIRASDIKLYVDTTDLAFTPIMTTLDRVIHIDGRVWNIKSVKEFLEGGDEDNILYILQLRA